MCILETSSEQSHVPAMPIREGSTFISSACSRKCTVALTQSSNGTGKECSGESR